MSNKDQIQKKENFANSIQPLQKNYFIFFLIWKLSIYNLYKGSIFWDIRYQKKIRKNLKRIAYYSQNSYMMLSFIVVFFGFIQIFSEYTGSSIFKLLESNVPILNTNKFQYNWKTFHILNSSLLRHRYPLSYPYQKIDIFSDSISLTLNSFYQNQKNHICFGFIPLNKTLTNNNSLFFKKNRHPILIKPLKFNMLDAIPNKMEGVAHNKQKSSFSILFESFESKENIKTIDSFIKNESNPKNILKSFSAKPKKSNDTLLKFVQKNKQNLIWKKRHRFRKNLITKNRNIFRFFARTRLKTNVAKLYRSFFYSQDYQDYKSLNPNIFLFKKFNNQKKISLISRNLKTDQLNYLDILSIIQKTEISFFNENLKPRVLSGYWLPDFEKPQKLTFSCGRPATFHVNLPGKYRSFFIESLSKTLKKQKRFLKKMSNTCFDNLHTNILYPQFQTPIFKINQNGGYKKQFTAYTLKPASPKTSLRPLNVAYFNSSPRTLGFKNYQFHDTREPIKAYSWLIISQIGVGILGFKLLQYLYQEYGKEIVLSLVNLINLIGILPDAEWLIDELNLSTYGKNFRAVRKVKKSFKEAAGITPLMAHFSEVLWQLRAKKTLGAKLFSIFNYSLDQNRSFVLQPVLLIGAPGTGKTLLVQALAGEAGVPVLIQSGSVLKDFRQRGKGARSIQHLFRRARQITPCIVFIDEVDGVGVRRESLSLNPMGGQDIMDAMNEAGSTPISFEDLENFQPKTELKNLLEEEENLELDEVLNFGETLTDAVQKNLLRIKVLQEAQVEQRSRTEQLSILTQLLIELDGLNPLNNIMVLGATNRPHILDPALLRPGRFYKIIKLNLPDQRKRIQILKLYIFHMKQKAPVPWSYLSQRMEGLSAADISAIVNESALISICDRKTHTLQSLETGFERVTSYSSSKNLVNYQRKLSGAHFSLRSRWFSSNFFIKNHKLIKKLPLKPQQFLIQPWVNDFLSSSLYKRMAYYQAGRSITQIILPTHPSSVYFAIQQREKNFRYISMHGLILSLMDGINYRSELEERLVGLLAGKASELLSGYASLLPHLKTGLKPSKFNISSTGGEDLQSATLLAFLMVEKWYFYAKKACIQTYHPILSNFNLHEFYQEDIKLFQAIFEDIESEIDTQNRLVSILKTQKWSFRTWWQKQLTDEESFFDKSIMDWYRIYLAEPEENEQNIEWVPPDDYYTGLNIRMTSSFIYWHHFLKLTYDHLYHSLLMNSFNISFRVLNQNRELLDYLVDFVLRYEKVRNHQIQILIEPFLNTRSKVNISDKIQRPVIKNDSVIFKSWGPKSRRSASRILNLEYMQNKDKLGEGVKNMILDSFQKLDIPKYLIKYSID